MAVDPARRLYNISIFLVITLPNFTLRLHPPVVIHYCTMVGFFSDLREMCEAAGNRALPKRPGAFGGMSPDETIWIDKLLREVRLS